MFNESIKRSLSTEQQTTSQNLQGANNTPFSLKMITSFSVTTQGCIATQLLQSLATTCRDKGCWHFQIMRTWPCKAWTIVLHNPTKTLGEEQESLLIQNPFKIISSRWFAPPWRPVSGEAVHHCYKGVDAHKVASFCHDRAVLVIDCVGWHHAQLRKQLTSLGWFQVKHLQGQPPWESS